MAVRLRTFTPKTDAYAVMWGGRGVNDELMAHTLKYGNGEYRTYARGHLDPRAGDEEAMPRFETAGEAIKYLDEHESDKCLVQVMAAKVIMPGRYADPVK